MLKSKLEAGVEPALIYSNDQVVEFYVSAWDDFYVGAKYNARVLHYMSRHYITAEYKTDTRFIRKLHAVSWKTFVFDKLAGELRK